MTHIAIQEKKDGKVVDWMEQVSDEQYASKDPGTITYESKGANNASRHS